MSVFDSHVPCNILLQTKFISAVVHVRTNRETLIQLAPVTGRQWVFRAIDPSWCPISDFPRRKLMVATKCHDVGCSVVYCNVILQIFLRKNVLYFWWRTDTTHRYGIVRG